MDRTDPHTPTTVKSPAHSSSRAHHPVISGGYSQFSKMDSDEVYAAAIQDLQEIFSLKVTHPLCCVAYISQLPNVFVLIVTMLSKCIYFKYSKYVLISTYV